MPPSTTKGRHFSDAARAAAIEGRRRKAAEAAAIPRGMPEVYVVRLQGAHLRFGWEIRRFGAVVLDRSTASYATMQEARTAGEGTLGAADGPAGCP